MYIGILYRFMNIVVTMSKTGNIVKYFFNLSKLNKFNIEVIIKDKLVKNNMSFRYI